MSNSNSNNPFLEENDNNNGNRNQNNKDNNTLPNYLEEGSSIAAPPPAYEDVVKPGYNYQHTYSPNNNPSYPPPSYPPPTASVAENLHTPANFNDKRGYQICCCNFSSRKKACCYGWIVLIIFIILGSVSIANNNVCKQLTLQNITREFSVDPNSYTRITFDVENSRSTRNQGVRISHNSLSNETGINIQVYTGSTDGVTPQFEEINGKGDTYNLRLYQKVGFSLFNIPPRCMIYRFDVILPQNVQNGTKIPTIHSRDLDIKVMESDQQYQEIALNTNSGDVNLDKINAKIMNITTTSNNGDIFGSIHPLPNSVASLYTNGGDVELTLNTNETSLSCDIKTDDGRIRVNGETRGEKFNQVFGGTDGKATLNIVTDDGDVNLQID